MIRLSVLWRGTREGQNRAGYRLADGAILAIPNYRLKPTGASTFQFWETPAGQPRAMRAWRGKHGVVFLRYRMTA
jgi:hypothetical protein